jgi:hypothetical protein
MWLAVLAFSLWQTESGNSSVVFDYSTALEHAVLPLHNVIPLEQGGRRGRLHVLVTVSKTGEVLDAEPREASPTLRELEGPSEMDLWPMVEPIARTWKFEPFKYHGEVAVAKVDVPVFFADLPKPSSRHVEPPALKPESLISISFHQSPGYFPAPIYTVTLTNEQVIFQGDGFVVAPGRHVAPISGGVLHTLAGEFIQADVFSSEDRYGTPVSDTSFREITISIDGTSKRVVDWCGVFCGMSQAVRDLEDRVNAVAKTAMWVRGADGLVDALRVEGFDFKSAQAQMMLKDTADRGATEAVISLLGVGVPIEPWLSKPVDHRYDGPGDRNFDTKGWLEVAAKHRDTLKSFLDANVSRANQSDKNAALRVAEGSGDEVAVRMLIDYGAAR